MYQENYFKSIYASLEDTQYLIEKVATSSNDFFEKIVLLTMKVKENSGRMFFLGNGASAAFSNHMALDWSKNGGILSFSLSDSAFYSALSNDYHFDDAFVEFMRIHSVGANDLVITTSSSGNSKNIIKTLEFCNENKIISLAFSGLKEDNNSVKLAKYSVYVPRKTYGQVECIHQIFLHLWLDKYMGLEDWDRTTFQNMSSNNFNL